jgi:hypothetical protein
MAKWNMGVVDRHICELLEAILKKLEVLEKKESKRK